MNHKLKTREVMSHTAAAYRNALPTPLRLLLVAAIGVVVWLLINDTYQNQDEQLNVESPASIESIELVDITRHFAGVNPVCVNLSVNTEATNICFQPADIAYTNHDDVLVGSVELTISGDEPLLDFVARLGYEGCYQLSSSLTGLVSVYDGEMEQRHGLPPGTVVTFFDPYPLCATPPPVGT